MGWWTAHRHAVTLMRLTLGWCFIVLGLLGLFLPVLQGLVFLALGMALLARHVPLFARLRDSMYRRHPRARIFVECVKLRARGLAARLRGRGAAPGR